jgi:hypothetical protein
MESCLTSSAGCYDNGAHASVRNVTRGRLTDGKGFQHREMLTLKLGRLSETCCASVTLVWATETNANVTVIHYTLFHKPRSGDRAITSKSDFLCRRSHVQFCFLSSGTLTDVPPSQCLVSSFLPHAFHPTALRHHLYAVCAPDGVVTQIINMLRMIWRY